MNQEKVIAFSKQAGARFELETILVSARDVHEFAFALASLVEQATLDRAAKACEDRMDDKVLKRNSSEYDCEAAGCAEAIRNLAKETTK